MAVSSPQSAEAVAVAPQLPNHPPPPQTGNRMRSGLNSTKRLAKMTTTTTKTTTTTTKTTTVFLAVIAFGAAAAIKVASAFVPSLPQSTLGGIFRSNPCRRRRLGIDFEYPSLGSSSDQNLSDDDDDDDDDDYKESQSVARRRMEMVRLLQKSYYSDEAGVAIDDDGATYRDVPLWRVQWTELPGHQNVLNVHVPHYTHMFMRVLNGPKPWYFGHLHLPGGSANMRDPTYDLSDPASDACRVGTLMRVCDYMQLDDDGRLVLIVQALRTFDVVGVTRTAPYAAATIRIRPDEELIAANMDEAWDIALERGLSGGAASEAARIGAAAEGRVS